MFWDTGEAVRQAHTVRAAPKTTQRGGSDEKRPSRLVLQHGPPCAHGTYALSPSPGGKEERGEAVQEVPGMPTVPKVRPVRDVPQMQRRAQKVQEVPLVQKMQELPKMPEL